MVRYTGRLIAIWLAVALAASATAHGQDSQQQDLAEQIEELKKGQEEIRQQLQQIRALLQQRQAPARPAGPDVAGKTFDLGKNPVKGATTARLTLVEFTDYQ